MKVASLYYELPEQLRATNPNDVSMVAWLEYGTYPVGRYLTGTGYAYTCTLSVVDASKNEIVDRKEFVGSNPPESKNYRGDAYGPRPDDKVLAYLMEDEPLLHAGGGRALVRLFG